MALKAGAGERSLAIVVVVVDARQASALPRVAANSKALVALLTIGGVRIKLPDWAKISDVTGALALGAAVAYLAGFWGWGYYARSQGLGFLHLSAPQYLAAGTSLLLLEALTWGALHVVIEGVSNATKEWPATGRHKVGRVVIELVVMGVTAVMLVLVVGYLGFVVGLFEVARFASWPVLVVAFLFPTIIYIVLNLSLAFPRLTSLPAHIRRLWQNRKTKADNPGILGERSAQFRLAAKWTAGAVVAILLGLFILPSISSTFGGAEPRHAYFDIERAGVSPETLARLVPAGALNTTAPVVRTVEIVVLFDNGDTVMVRRADKAAPSDALFDLSASVVKARIWLPPR